MERNALDRLNLPEDPRVLAGELFEMIDRVAAMRPQPAIDEALAAELLRRQEEDQAVRLAPAAERTGRQAAGAAWLIAQHADRQTEFQQECLELLSAAVTAGDADPQHGALLEDRVGIAQGRERIFSAPS
ncbi:hypothetical protein ABT403_12000 [Streptomyces sp. NPDC000075]|uniref:hypothetical protein n=1 Tax=Streptomyces TaxID=1883 RepID=UPI0031E25825